MIKEENYLKKELYDLIKKDASVFEFLQSGSLDGIWFWDLEKPENEWMSPRFWTNFGYNPSEKEHLSKEWQNMIFKEDLETATDNFNKHCADPNYPYDQTVRYIKKDGSTAWVRCRGIAIRDKHGKPLRMLGAHNDISSIKEAEQMNRSLLEEMPSAFSLHEIVLDKQGTPINYKFIEVNSAFEKITNLKRENIIGKNVTEIFPETKKDQTNWIEKYGKVALTGKSIKFKNYSQTMNKWFSISSYSPKKNFFVTIFDDITKIVDTEKNLQEKIEELEKINSIMIGRELKMAELKKQITELKNK